MCKIKYVLLAVIVSAFISCGSRDEEETAENETGKTEQPAVTKEGPGEQHSDTTTEKQLSKKETTGTDELKFYSKTEKPEAVISAVEAGDYIGKVVTVNGFVADVYKTERVAYLNFVEKFPKNPFSAVIFPGKFEAFGDLNIYEGKNISVTGRVTVYKEKPQIILDGKEQVKILE